VKILFRGGSISAGRGVGSGYVDMLREDPLFRGSDIINRSRPRETSFDCVWSFKEDIEPYRPEILVLHFAMDDAYFPVYRSEFKENLVQTVRLARNLFRPLILLMTSHTFDDPYDMDAVNIYYRVIREVSLDLDCGMVPVHTLWRGMLMERGMTNRDLTLHDTRLPNEKGHELYAEIMTHVLGKMV
jgi:hypothetical protein